MVVDRQLTDVEFDQLLVWLRDKEFKWNRLHRDCSDGVKIAQLIKRLWPRFVDLHNYPPQCNISQKRANWDVLNRKVLIKLGLHQKPVALDLLARSTPGFVEVLLYDIMRVKEYQDDSDLERGASNKWVLNNELYIVNVQKKVGKNLMKIEQKMIPYKVYEAKIHESDTKDSIIKACEQKVSHLENLIKLKADCITELTSQRERLVLQTSMLTSNIALAGSKPKSNTQHQTDKRAVEIVDLTRFYR